MEYCEIKGDQVVERSSKSLQILGKACGIILLFVHNNGCQWTIQLQSVGDLTLAIIYHQLKAERPSP